MRSNPPEVSVIVVSFNTRELLRDCLNNVLVETASLDAEVIVIDNGSRDGSAAMVQESFPQVALLQSEVNLGFGEANNRAFAVARGQYFALLNSDAFFAPGALVLALRHMQQNLQCALGGGKLVGRNGSWQPSARAFHSLWSDAIVLTGLAARFPRSRLFGSFDRTWADEDASCEVDWVPGAFSIIRREALDRVGVFDPGFFLYYEEVDLCRRLKQAGYSIHYWPDIVVTHIGGESSRQLKSLAFSREASQVVLWRMRSTLLYYRKHHGWQAWCAKWLEKGLYRVIVLRNHFSSSPSRRQRQIYYNKMLNLMDQAWNDTKGGRISPQRPW